MSYFFHEGTPADVSSNTTTSVKAENTKISNNSRNQITYPDNITGKRQVGKRNSLPLSQTHFS